MGILFGTGLFELMFAVVFLIVIAGFILVFVRGAAQWNKNNQAPRLTVEATVVSRRSDVSWHSHHNGADASMGMHTTSHTTYYATFQVASGDRMEFAVPGTEYGMLAEGDRGVLTFQGTRYLEFRRN